MFDLGVGYEGERVGGLLSIVLLEGVGILITVSAFMLILVASIKLIRGTNLPGTRLIFYSIIGSILGALLSASQIVLFGDDGNYILESVISIILSVIFFVGAYGFLSLARYLANNYSAKSSNKGE